jgi:ABC-type uncharacterized transport system substrate-binding protein
LRKSCSLKKGALLGLGFPEEITGKAAAEKALLVLENGIHPSKIPVTPTPLTYKLKINKKRLSVSKMLQLVA